MFSRTLGRADWNTTVIPDLVPEKVLELKAQPGGDLALGGATLAAAFMRHDLIDEYRIYVHPIMIGQGKPLFQPSEAGSASASPMSGRSETASSSSVTCGLTRKVRPCRRHSRDPAGNVLFLSPHPLRNAVLHRTGAGDSRRGHMKKPDQPTALTKPDAEDVIGTSFGQGRAKRAGMLAITTVVTTVIGAIVTMNLDSLRTWVSAREPLEILVSTSSTPPLVGFSMVVPDPGRLPPNLAGVGSCDALWEVGVDAGGLRADGAEQSVLLQGRAEDGVTIVDMHAEITRTAPAIDGARLHCPGAGLIEPIGLVFDLGRLEAASARRIDPNSGEATNLFSDGFAISVADNESVPLAIELFLPQDAVYWHLEAEAIIAGERRNIIIDNDGEDFFSPGRRPLNQYREGHGAGVFLTDWGVDDTARRLELPNGTENLLYGGAHFSDTAGLEAYRPAGWGASYEQPVPERWIRRDGRQLLEFNTEAPPDRPLRPFPGLGDYCQDDELYRDDSDQDFGKVANVSVASTAERDHGGQTFRHFEVDYTCAKADGTEAFYQLLVAQEVNTLFAFSSLTSKLTEQDRLLAERLLNEVRLNADS